MLRKHITIICTYMCIIPAGKRERGEKRGGGRENTLKMLVGGCEREREGGRKREKEGREGGGEILK